MYISSSLFFMLLKLDVLQNFSIKKETKSYLHELRQVEVDIFIIKALRKITKCLSIFLLSLFLGDLKTTNSVP